MKLGIAVVAVAIAAAGCLPSSRSDEFACSGQEDCEAGRLCESGFCVLESCPGECDSCDTVARTCTISCNGNQCRNRVACPDGYACTISCPDGNACGTVDCTGAASCDITCSGIGACDRIECGSGACNVTCSSDNACGAVACADSCKCDVSCPGGTCNTTCPGGDTCTIDGTSGSPCASTSCATC